MTTKTTRIGRRLAIGGLAGAGALLGAPAILRAQQVKWIGASVAPASDFISIALDVFAKRAAELTGGQVQIATHHGGALGGERENVEGLLQGAVQVATPGAAILGGWYKPAEVWTYPYLFKDVAHKDRVMTALMPEYGEDVAKTMKVRPMASIPRMPRMVSSSRVIRTPADMKGLKIRVPETTMWRRTFERFGASPTPMAWPEVFQALKSGVIDAQENPMALTFNSGIYDVSKNLALTEHMMQDNVLIVADAAFQRLSEPLRQALVKAGRDMEDDLRPRVVADDNRILEEVKKKNITINEVDKAAFRAALQGMDAEFPHVKKWVDRIGQIA